jgi:hypothetical protein
VELVKRHAEALADETLDSAPITVISGARQGKSPSASWRHAIALYVGSRAVPFGVRLWALPTSTLWRA